MAFALCRSFRHSSNLGTSRDAVFFASHKLHPTSFLYCVSLDPLATPSDKQSCKRIGTVLPFVHHFLFPLADLQRPQTAAHGFLYLRAFSLPDSEAMSLLVLRTIKQDYYRTPKYLTLFLTQRQQTLTFKISLLLLHAHST